MSNTHDNRRTPVRQSSKGAIVLSVSLHAVLVAALLFNLQGDSRRSLGTNEVQFEAIEVDQRVVEEVLERREAVRQAAEEARQREIAEAERQAREEAERQAREEAERQARLERERREAEAAAEAQRQERLEAERREREEAERLAREAAEREAREEAERLAREEAERQAREEAERQAREEAERQAREEAERKARLERERQAQLQAAREAQLQAALEAEEALRRARESGELDRYLRSIQARIEAAWNQPASAKPGLECIVHVTQVPGGQVVSARVGTCNGDEAVRQSIERAVLRASPLPEPSIPALFERNLEITFRPQL